VHTMSSPGDSSRPLSASRSLLANSTANSRPFLNMLSPLGASRKYAGYARARESVLEEDDEDEGARTETERDVEAAAPAPARRVSFRSASSLRPNVHGTERDADSSDDEVPQSFMIETSAAPAAAQSDALRRARIKGKERERPPRAGSSRSAVSGDAPILPVGAELPSVSAPPRPSELSVDDTGVDADGDPSSSRPRPTMRGLDAYERALWNWVNVYNLDAFLQEVYYYYEGKGIYCIALSRVLNLL
jgi:autophagy-related protein 9